MTVLAVAMFRSTAASKPKRSTSKPFPFSAPANETAPAELRPQIGSPMQSAAVADTFELAVFDFQNGNAPDPQGWFSVDWTAQIDEFFHIASGSELDGGTHGTLLPLEGSQSLWCGATVSTNTEFCGYASLPGYGNQWEQYFVSDPFICDSIQFSYKVQWDSEEAYDFTFVEYYDSTSMMWVPLPVDAGTGYYDGSGSLFESIGFSISEDATQIRFLFTSDGAFSDQDGLFPSDGAILIDSMTVECYNDGVLSTVLFEDFEGELAGSKTTDDGWWAAEPDPSYGDFAALYPGTSVLQEDPCVFQNNLWGFFTDPLIAGYDCHLPDPRPDQGVIGFVNDDGVYIDNNVWSPKIALTGAGDEYIFTFRVYRDLTLNGLVGYTWRVRSWVNGCPERWEDFSSGFHNGAQKDWLTHTLQIGSLIEDGATHVQLLLGVQDWCFVWCNVYGTGSCHSHAPLFDDVRLVRVNTVGPQFGIRDLELFQDSFAEDGSLSGTARADAAFDILPSSSSAILPGDSITVTVDDPGVGLAVDPLSGIGPAIYAYVAVWPLDQLGKTGADMEAPESRSIGKRFPFVGTLVDDGVTWNCFRMDTSLATAGVPIADRYSFDLNDDLFTPGDTVCYFLKATNTNNISTYASRRFGGQGRHFFTDDISEAFASPMEFTILPAGGVSNGGDVLYVDDADDRGGDFPIQLFFDSAFRDLGILEQVDRYDILSPSSVVGNSLASRVRDVTNQIIGPYQKIIWSSANLSAGTIGDGTGNPEKSDDFALLQLFADRDPNNPGVFLTGDNIGEEWVTLNGPSAITFKSAFLTFNLLDGDHVRHGEAITPDLVAASSVFSHAGDPDEILAYGGCPSINQFDVFAPTGSSQADFVSTSSGDAFVISKETPNVESTTARVMLSGFSLHEAGDLEPIFPYARAEILLDVLEYFQNSLPTPSGIDDAAPQLANYLGDNYPNPFNPSTTIRYGIKEKSHVSLTVYNAAGQLVRTLVDEVQIPKQGGFKVEWNGESDSGTQVATGVYFYRLVAGNFELTKKMVLLK